MNTFRTLCVQHMSRQTKTASDQLLLGGGGGGGKWNFSAEAINLKSAFWHHKKVLVKSSQRAIDLCLRTDKTCSTIKPMRLLANKWWVFEEEKTEEKNSDLSHCDFLFLEQVLKLGCVLYNRQLTGLKQTKKHTRKTIKVKDPQKEILLLGVVTVKMNMPMIWPNQHTQ